MAKALASRGRGLVKGDGAWRSFMAYDETDDAGMLPDSPRADEAQEYEDVTTLDSGSLLSNVKPKRLKRASTRIKVGVILNRPESRGDDGSSGIQSGDAHPTDAAVSTASSGATASDLGAVISQQPGAAPQAASVFDNEESFDGEDLELLDVDQEEDEWGALKVSRFGQPLTLLEQRYREYRKLKAKEDKTGTKPSCCSWGWLFPTRSCKARFLLCCIRCGAGGPETPCAFCLGIARRPRGEVALHGSLPRRNKCDVCMDHTLIWGRRCYYGPETPPDDDEDATGAEEGDKSTAAVPGAGTNRLGRSASVAPEITAETPATDSETKDEIAVADQAEDYKAKDETAAATQEKSEDVEGDQANDEANEADGEVGKPVGPPVLRVGLVHMRAVQALVHFLMGLETEKFKPLEPAAKDGTLDDGSVARGALPGAEDPFMVLSEKEVAAIEKAKAAEDAAFKARAAKAVTSLLLDDNILSLEATWRLTAWLAGTQGATTHLTKLSLCHCDLGPRSTMLVVESLPRLLSLQHLNLACNPRLSIPVLSAGISNPRACPALKHLSVALCEGSEAEIVDLIVATTRLSSCPNVRELELWQNLTASHWSWQHLAMISEALADWGWLPNAKRPGQEDSDSDSSDEEEELNGTGKSRVGGGSIVPPLGIEHHSSNNGIQGSLKDVSLIRPPTSKDCSTPTSRPHKLPFVVTGRRVRLLPTRWLNIDDLRTTKVITLAQQELCDEEVYAIACSLGRNKHVRTIDLSYNQFGSVGAKAVLKEVGTKKGLHVDLGGNGLGKEVVGTWLWNACELETLRLTGGGFTLSVQDLKGLPRLSPSGQIVHEALEVLNLTQEDIGPMEQEALSHLFKFNSACCELNGLIFHDNMTSVDLSLAPLELYEVIFIAKRLDLNFVVLDLNLSGCSVDAESGAFLVQAIGKHKSLQSVRLDNNLLADDGARSLGRQIRDNVCIRKLDVSYNAISDTGLAALLFGLLMGPPPPKPKEKVALAKLKTANALIRQNATLKLGNHSPISGAPKNGSAESPAAKGTGKEDDADVGKEFTSKAGDELGKEVSGEAKTNELVQGDESKESTEAQIVVAESSETVGNSSGDDEEEATLATEEKENDDEDDDDEPVMLDEEAAAAAGLGPAVRKVVTKDQTTVDLMALVGPPPLQELDLSGNVLGPRAINVLQRSPMGRHPISGKSVYSSLRFLSLRSVSFNDRSMAAFAKALYHDRQAAAKQSRRNYNDDAADKEDGAFGASAEDEPEGPRFPALTGLDLTGHHAWDSGIVALSQVCEKVDALKILRLGKAMASKEEYEDEDGGGTGRDKDGTPKGMKTSRRGVLALVSLLENHAGLTEVDLFNMDIGDYGAVALGKVVDSNASLQSLCLEKNGIGGAGGEALLRALGPNIGIKSMNLSQNPIGRGRGEGHGAVYELAGMLMLNNTLQVLDLSSCDLNGYGSNGRGFNKHLERVCDVFADGLFSAGTFTNLRVSDNRRIPIALLKRLREAAKPPLVIDFLSAEKHI